MNDSQPASGGDLVLSDSESEQSPFSHLSMGNGHQTGSEWVVGSSDEDRTAKAPASSGAGARARAGAGAGARGGAGAGARGGGRGGAQRGIMKITTSKTVRRKVGQNQFVHVTDKSVVMQIYVRVYDGSRDVSKQVYLKSDLLHPSHPHCQEHCDFCRDVFDKLFILAEHEKLKQPTLAVFLQAMRTNGIPINDPAPTLLTSKGKNHLSTGPRLSQYIQGFLDKPFFVPVAKSTGPNAAQQTLTTEGAVPAAMSQPAQPMTLSAAVAQPMTLGAAIAHYGTAHGTVDGSGADSIFAHVHVQHQAYSHSQLYPNPSHGHSCAPLPPLSFNFQPPPPRQ